MSQLDYVGWYSAPNLRSTMDLVWGCAFTVFVCTWTALHANVPPYRSSWYWRMGYKFRLMMVAILAPEYVAGMALTELSTALALKKEMRRSGLSKWTLKQSFFVQMGGYMVVNGDDSLARPVPANVFMHLLLLGHIKLSQPASGGNNRNATISATDHKTNSTIIAHKSSKMLTIKGDTYPFGTAITSTNAISIPWISDDDIDDLSKASYLLKAISCVQICWIIIQSIARQIQSLALCPLEATTIAYIACALVSYAAWWKKPYDLESPSIIRVASDHQMAQYLPAITSPKRIPFSSDPAVKLDKPIYWSYCGACVAMLQMYSGLHFLAWSMPFVSFIEQQLWRWLTVTLFGLHWLFLIIIITTHADISVPLARDTCISCWLWCLDRTLQPVASAKLKDALRTIHLLDSGFDQQLVPKWYVMVPILGLTTLYMLSRMYLLVEAFVGLRQVPMSLYKTVDWVQFLPTLN